MRSDRELLELAARANWAREVADDEISLRYCEINDGILYLHADNQDHNGHDREFVWNPLTDDGDALRLAVKLKLWLHVEEYGASARRSGGAWIGCEAHIHGGIEAATRRAIVRAAAALAHPDNNDGGAVYG